MRKPPRHVECCAVLGPRSQGETALPLRVLLVRRRRKRKRNRHRAWRRRPSRRTTRACFSRRTHTLKLAVKLRITNSCGSDPRLSAKTPANGRREQITDGGWSSARENLALASS
jgi:hypothetical protein